MYVLLLPLLPPAMVMVMPGLRLVAALHGCCYGIAKCIGVAVAHCRSPVSRWKSAPRDSLAEHGGRRIDYGTSVVNLLECLERRGRQDDGLRVLGFPRKDTVRRPWCSDQQPYSA